MDYRNGVTFIVIKQTFVVPSLKPIHRPSETAIAALPWKQFQNKYFNVVSNSVEIVTLLIEVKNQNGFENNGQTAYPED